MKLSKNGTQHYGGVLLSLVLYMLSVSYAECHMRALYAECYYYECRYVECRYAVCRSAFRLGNI